MTEHEHPDLGTRAVWAGEPGFDSGKAPGGGAIRVFEEKIAALEGAPAALGFSSGKGAVAAALLTLLGPGDTLIAVPDSWSAIPAGLLEFLGRIKVRVEFCPTRETGDLAQKIARGCKAVYLESPLGPELRTLDLAGLARTAQKQGAALVVDNTQATPINQNPLDQGADLVVHSNARFLSGRAWALGGAVCGPEELIQKIAVRQKALGSAIHPQAAYLLLQDMKTLHLRVARQNRSALALAHWLEGRDQVEQVYYPGLPEDPGHEQAKAQMRGFGGLLSFTLKEGARAAERLIGNLRYAQAYTGVVETAALRPGGFWTDLGGSRGKSWTDQAPGLVCYSVGVEDVEDLRADLSWALKAVDLPLEGGTGPQKERSGPSNPFYELYSYLAR